MTPTSGQGAPAPSDVSSEPSGIVTEAVSADAKSFHIYQASDSVSRDFQFRVYASGLWQRDPATNQPIPYMAKDWSLSEDGRTFTFNLRDDMKWSDGEPITAHDFVWTFDQAHNPDNNYQFITILDAIESYTAKDDHTLEVVMKEPGCTGLLAAGQITPLPKHIWADLPWGDPTGNPEILNPTVVSGPWQLKEWERDDHATFTPNPTYFGGPPRLESYVVRVVPDPAVQYQMLASGDVDVAPVSAADYDKAKELPGVNLYTWEPAQPTWYFIGFNLKQPVLQDIHLRQALAHTMPREQIGQTIFHGLSKPLSSTYSPPNWVYNDQVAKYEGGVDAGRALLEKNGYKWDSNGKLIAPSGDPVTLRLFYPTTDPQREAIALVAQEEMGKLGVDVDIAGQESKAMFEHLVSEPNDWHMWMGLSRDTSDPHFMYQAWSESTIPNLNTGAYINKDVEKLFAEGNSPPCDPASRRKPYQRIQEIIAEEAPYVFLVYNTAYAFVRDRVHVNEPSVIGISYRQNEWTAAK